MVQNLGSVKFTSYVFLSVLSSSDLAVTTHRIYYITNRYLIQRLHKKTAENQILQENPLKVFDLVLVDWFIFIYQLWSCLVRYVQKFYRQGYNMVLKKHHAQNLLNQIYGRCLANDFTKKTAVAHWHTVSSGSMGGGAKGTWLKF